MIFQALRSATQLSKISTPLSPTLIFHGESAWKVQAVKVIGNRFVVVNVVYDVLICFMSFAYEKTHFKKPVDVGKRDPNE